MAITYSDDARAHVIESIKRFFSEELGEDIGDLKALNVLDFFDKEIAPTVYNQALADANAYFVEKASDLANVRWQPEFDFWKRRT